MDGEKIKNVVGLISIKDIFEDIMQEEIIDEDQHVVSSDPKGKKFRVRSSIFQSMENTEGCEGKEPLLDA